MLHAGADFPKLGHSEHDPCPLVRWSVLLILVKTCIYCLLYCYTVPRTGDEANSKVLDCRVLFQDHGKVSKGTAEGGRQAEDTINMNRLSI